MSRFSRPFAIMGLLLFLISSLKNSQPTHAQTGVLARQGPTIHVVQPGESVSSISQFYAIDPALIYAANGLDSPSSIVIGERLLIPAQPANQLPVSEDTVIVGIGETLDEIAARHGILTQKIALANGIVQPDSVYAGETIVIPSDAANARIRQVTQIGDYADLSELAQTSNSNLFALILLNELDNPFDVAPGQFIILPNDHQESKRHGLAWLEATMSSLPLEAGRSGELRVSIMKDGALSANFLSKELSFRQDGDSYLAIFGVDRWTEPGLYPLTISLSDNTGAVSLVTYNVEIVRGNYASETVKLSADATTARDDPEIVAGENAYLARVMSGFTPEKYWSGQFLLPSTGILTSAFGSVRSINGGGYDSYHAGNDFAAQVGTPIFAPANGVVVDTGLLDIRGLITIINHGSGVYSGFWHQASILVKPGDKVHAGQQIGTIGNTGSSSASHLHWEMWVGGVPVDSLQWVRQSFQ